MNCRACTSKQDELTVLRRENAELKAMMASALRDFEDIQHHASPPFFSEKWTNYVRVVAADAISDLSAIDAQRARTK